MGQRHKILIVDDHPITQSGLRLLLAGQDRYEVIGALDRGATVSAFVRSQPVDPVILDLNMPDMRRVNILAAIVGYRDMTVLILTGDTRHAPVAFALNPGAPAVVAQSDPDPERSDGPRCG